MNLERKTCNGKKETIISTLGSTVSASHCSSLLPDLSIFFSDPKNNFITASKMVPLPFLQRLSSLCLWKLMKGRSSWCFESWKCGKMVKQTRILLACSNQESDHAKPQNRSQSSLGKQDMLSLWPLADLQKERAKIVSISGQWNQHQGHRKLRELPGFGKEQSNDTAVFKGWVKW